MKYWFFIAVLLANALGRAAVAPNREEEKPAIPADLYKQFKLVPADENAIVDWHEAAALEARLGEDLRDKIRFCWTPFASEPSEQELNALKSWLRRDKQALDLFENSLKKPHAQWLVTDTDDSQPEVAALNYAAEARMLEADLRARDGDFSNSLASLEGTLKLAQRGVDGDADVFQYLVSSRIRTRVQEAMKRLASRHQMPEPLLRRLIKDLPRLDSETNSYANVLRVEFMRYADRSTDVQKMAKTWSNLAETNDAFLLYPEELRRPLKVLLDPMLVAAHPKPLDEVIEIKKSINYFRIFRTNSVSIWADRNDAVEEERAETIKKLIADIKPLMDVVKGEPLPLSRHAAERAREAYLQIENPIGRITDGKEEFFSYSDKLVFRNRTEREAARAILGMIWFEGKKGALPGKLSELADAGILDSVPTDYFANAPLSYSRERRVVWSVGEDGSNDGGKSGRFSWYTDDAVWQIPRRIN